MLHVAKSMKNIEVVNMTRLITGDGLMVACCNCCDGWTSELGFLLKLKPFNLALASSGRERRGGEMSQVHQPSHPSELVL